MDASLQADVEMIGGIDSVPRILVATRRMTGMDLAAIVRVRAAGAVACAVSDAAGSGLEPGDAIGAGEAVCRQVRRTGEPVVIDDAARDPGHGEGAGFGSCVAFPVILRDGSFYGVLCAFDPRPRGPDGASPPDVLALFADLIAAQIESALRLDVTRRSLEDEKATTELREQFIAVLGHDLRNPVASMVSGTRMLAQMPLSHNAMTIVKLMQGSATRMNGLIDNLLDFARGRMGDGLTVMRSTEIPLRPVLMQAIEELRATSHHAIDARFDFEDPVNCDTARIGQLATNLVGNAILHGASDAPVTVRAWREGGLFHLSVANGGAPIPEEARATLFEPFSGRAGGRREGLGLGLYIAAEIARRHKGGIDVVSTAEETRFTLTMAA